MSGPRALRPVRVVAPAASPVSLAEAKAHLSVTFDDDDGLISVCLGAAVAHLDGWAGRLGRCLIQQDWRCDFDGFPAGPVLRLPFPDVSAVVSIDYRDPAGLSQTLDPARYVGPFDDALGAYVRLAGAASWPSSAVCDDAVSVTLTAGFGVDSAAVPFPLRAAILLIVGDLYANREAKIAASLAENPTLAMLVAPYRRVGF